MKERLQQLRTTIDGSSPQMPNALSPEQQELASYYLPLEEGESGLEFTIKDLNDYLDDWHKRNIHTAEEFIKRAIDDHYAVFERVFKYHEAAGAKSQIIFGHIKSKIDKAYEERAQRARHYVDPDDPDRFVFDKKKLGTYIKDWLVGIDAAEDFLVKAMEEDFQYFMSIIDTFSLKEINKLLDLVLKNPRIDALNIPIVRYKQAIATAVAGGLNHTQLGPLLDELYGLGIMSQVFSNNPELIKVILGPPYLEGDDQIYSTALLYVKNPDTIADFILNIPADYQADAGDKLFLAGLINVSSDLVFSFFLSLKERATSKTNQQPKEETKLEIKTQEEPTVVFGKREVIKLKKNITLDYYMNSSLQAEKDLLDMAYQENPQLFTKLFCQELSFFRNIPASCDFIKRREPFYRKLMDQVDMVNFSHYQTCLTAVNDAFEVMSLEPIPNARPKKSLFSFGSSPKKKEIVQFHEDLGNLPTTTTTTTSTNHNQQTAITGKNDENIFSNALSKFSEFFTPKPPEKKMEVKEMVKKEHDSDDENNFNL